jgi:hypothetical protein
VIDGSLCSVEVRADSVAAQLAAAPDLGSRRSPAAGERQKPLETGHIYGDRHVRL